MPGLFNYLKFLFTSTNQHGVHSPFVFDYLTKCLYRKKVDSNSKTMDILLKSISYFEYSTMQVIGNEHAKELVQQKFKNIEFDQHPTDLIFFNEIVSDFLPIVLSEGKTHHNSMVLINDIHRNGNSTESWNEIIKEKKATVTIDFFYCGVIFFRQEQAKEHFNLRI